MQNNRVFKGKSVNKYVSDYCLLDLETTGKFVNSADIIEISILKVRNNEVIDAFSSLVNPHCHIPFEATAVNHITDDMVQDAPEMKDLLDDFLTFVGNDVIVGYNNAAFDMCLIYDVVLELKGEYFINDYIDVYHAARRSIVGLENYKLETISQNYGFDTEGEHRALKDCYLTKNCYDKLYANFGNIAFKSRGHHTVKNAIQHTTETLALQELQQILESIIKDNKVTLDEVETLCFWMEEHRNLQGKFPFGRVFDALDKINEDGEIDLKKLEELLVLFSTFVDPVKNQSCHDKIDCLIGKHICITGEFNYGSRNEVFALIERVGGIIDKQVRKSSTNYLVVGSKGSVNWKTGNYGGKIQKVMEYNNQGANINIIEEQEFIQAIEDCDESPMLINNSTEYIELFDWKVLVKEMLESVIIEKELPEGSLNLKENYDKNRKNVTSYSVSIYEPEYPKLPNTNTDPTRNSIVLNIKEKKNGLELLINKIQFGDIEKPLGAEIKELKSDEANMHVIFPIDSSSLVEYIQKNVEYSLINYTSKASSFACCSQFVACSNAKRCIHENKLYSKACMYRANLDSGKIFYGKNRNID